MKKILLQIKLIVSPILNWTLIITSIYIAFQIGYYYTTIKEYFLNKKNHNIEIFDTNVCSVSVTDRGELLILNRNNSKYYIYSENVGLAIFKTYGSRITANYEK